MSKTVRSASFILDKPPKKRKKFTRSATGCKACRSQRVKCPEGPVLSDPHDGKVICKRCWETDTPCYYPVNGKSIRRKNRDGDGDWERAAPGDYWEDMSRQTAMTVGSTERSSCEAAGGEWDWDAFLSDIQSTPLVTSQTPGITSIEPTDQDAKQVPAEISISDMEVITSSNNGIVNSKPIEPFAMVSSSRNTVVPVVPLVDRNSPLDWLQSLLSPTPPPVLNTFTIASLLSPDIISETSRPVVSYFEHEGCDEIVSTNKRKHNWIFSQLFPRLFATLSTSSANMDTVSGLVRQWLQACLVQLSYVHRGNVEKDPSRRYIWRSESDKARQRGNYVLLRAKVKYPEGQWKTEEYLMGFFVRCMADMLSASKLVIDDTTAFELPVETSSEFYPSLKDLIALYSVIDHACEPLTPSLASTQRFLMPTSGPEWVERFVGFSRRIVIKLGEVSGLVVNRWALIHAGTDTGVVGLLLRTQAEKLLRELGDGWDWEEHQEDVGQTDRIQRGNGVMRCALQTILLCEILDTDLADPRLHIARERAIELVVDAEPSSLGGFQWPLTILAIYCRETEVRKRLQTVLHQALNLSFGTGYRGTDEVLELCWEVLDSKGRYRFGIAPWREALAAFERSLFV